MVSGLIISCLVWLTSITSPDYYGLLFNLKIFFIILCVQCWQLNPTCIKLYMVDTDDTYHDRWTYKSESDQ